VNPQGSSEVATPEGLAMISGKDRVAEAPGGNSVAGLVRVEHRASA
jgi:hypothetical protein